MVFTWTCGHYLSADTIVLPTYSVAMGWFLPKMRERKHLIVPRRLIREHSGIGFVPEFRLPSFLLLISAVGILLKVDWPEEEIRVWPNRPHLDVNVLTAPSHRIRNFCHRRRFRLIRRKMCVCVCVPSIALWTLSNGTSNSPTAIDKKKMKSWDIYIYIICV